MQRPYRPEHHRVDDRWHRFLTYQQFHDRLAHQHRQRRHETVHVMSPYTVTDISEASMADLYAYVHSLPISDVVNKGTSCPE